MAEPKFTLGPWVFQPIADRHRGWIKSVCKGFPERVVARAEGQEDAAEREANSYLIAAAPELYGALAAALESATADPDCDPDSIETENDLRRCSEQCAEFGCMELKARDWRALLAKARGERP